MIDVSLARRMLSTTILIRVHTSTFQILRARQIQFEKGEAND
jgi:hypothetical protein